MVALWHVLLVGVAGLAVAASPEECAEQESEEVSQLQRSASTSSRRRPCSPECQNGGRCVRGLYCKCVAGYHGPGCSQVEELRENPHSGSGPDNFAEEQCDVGFDVFPYIQPHLWGTSYVGWELCGEGREQSPIDIVTKKAKNKKASPLNLQFNKQEHPGIVNNGHSIEAEGNFVTLKMGGDKYEASQFHFHSPSENTVNGKAYPMEMHIVTSGDAGPAVLAVFFKFGKHNSCIAEILQKAPRAGCQIHISDIDLGTGKCFKEQLKGDYWSFDGSLTTPPCTEGVKWQVMKQVATISRKQLRQFKTRYVMNARPVQALGKRTVTLNKVTGGMYE